MSELLELTNVSAAYGPFRALFDVSITIRPGEAVALLGANGVGKTTIARVATGLLESSTGTVMFDGTDLTGAAPHRFARVGVAHAPEGRSVFATLSVEENLRLSFRRSKGRAGVGDAIERAFGLFPALGERRRQIAGTLSGGQQRMLAMARVIIEEPRLLVADELSLGLAPIIVDEVYRNLDRLKQSGCALLIVEQHVGHAIALCDRAVVLDRGRITWTGPSDQASNRIARSLFQTEADNPPSD